MIEQIKSLKRDLVINLFNPYAKYFYKLDSVNLIIGNNGKGKTTLIRDIIRDITEVGSPIEYIADGVNDKLGIIYYTATPFYKSIKVSSRSFVAFVDASKPAHGKQSFIDSSKEYLEIAKLLKLEDSLKSIQSFDLEDVSFDLAIALCSEVVARKDLEQPIDQKFDIILEEYRRYRRLNMKYRSVNSEIAEENLSAHSRNDASEQFNMKLRYLNNQLEDIAKEIINSKKFIANEFLYQCGPHRPAMYATWITAATLLKDKTTASFRRELAYHIYQPWDRSGNISGRFDVDYARIKNLVIRFVSIIDKNRCGYVEYIDNQIKINVDTAKLIKSRFNRDTIEEGSKIGLIRIGFDEMSSGQAAIMHQMISISQSIQDLISQGKKNILIFIDEGDLLLHLKWQREYIALLDNRLANFKLGHGLDSLQVIIASHSPLLASDVLRDSITALDERSKLPSFGAPIQRIINYSFGTPSIGLIAQEAIKELDKKNILDERDLEILGQIDDDFIRRHLKEKSE